MLGDKNGNKWEGNAGTSRQQPVKTVKMDAKAMANGNGNAGCWLLPLTRADPIVQQ